MPTMSLSRLRDALVTTANALEQIAARDAEWGGDILGQVAALREITTDLQTLIDRLQDTWG